MKSHSANRLLNSLPSLQTDWGREREGGQGGGKEGEGME